MYKKRGAFMYCGNGNFTAEEMKYMKLLSDQYKKYQ